MNLYEFEVSLVHMMSFRSARTTQLDPVSKQNEDKMKIWFLKLILKLCPKFPNSEPEPSPR